MGNQVSSSNKSNQTSQQLGSQCNCSQNDIILARKKLSELTAEHNKSSRLLARARSKYSNTDKKNCSTIIGQKGGNCEKCMQTLNIINNRIENLQKEIKRNKEQVRDRIKDFKERCISRHGIQRGGNDYYYNKYIKYKNKYLDEKNNNKY